MARNKTGILGSAGNTLISAFAIGENTTGLISDSLVVGREYLKPSLMEAKVETLTVMAEGVADLMKLGVKEEEARAYLSVAL